MPERHRVGTDHAYGKPDYAALSDAELTERIRAGAPSANPATQELKRRHLPAVLGYARLCGRNQVAGNQLALQAFGLAAQEAFRGIEPQGNWRHHLLMLVQRAGLVWAADSRRHRLESDFATWLDGTAEVTAPGLPEGQYLRLEASSAMLTGFYRLPELTRGVLWYSVVDEEPDATVATFLDVEESSVAELRGKAQDAMRQAYVRAYLERCDDRKCLGYRRIIEAAAQPGDRRRSEDLTLHLAECPSCTRLVAELTRYEEAPRAVLAEGLLVWGGAAYVSRGPVRALLEALPAQPDRSGAAAGAAAFTTSMSRPRRERSRSMGATRLSLPVVLVAAAVVTAVVVGTLLLATTSADRTPAPDRAATPSLPQAWPADPAPAPSPSATSKPAPTPSASPRPTKKPTAKPPAPAPTKSAPPRLVPIVAGGGYTQVVNAASGLCLDIEDGVMENRTDVITVPCNGARTQQWSLEPIGLLRSNADPDFCLDSRGDTDRGVGIWSCSSVNGNNGLNLLFLVDGAGVIRPQIAPDHALEPEGGSLGFDPADGAADQHWTAGAA